MLERGSGTQSALDAELLRIAVDLAALDVALVLPSNESVLSANKAGIGVAALPTLVVEPSIAAGTAARSPSTSAPGLRHKERFRSKAADALLRLIAERAQSEPRFTSLNAIDVSLEPKLTVPWPAGYRTKYFVSAPLTYAE